MCMHKKLRLHNVHFSIFEIFEIILVSKLYSRILSLQSDKPFFSARLTTGTPTVWPTRKPKHFLA